MESEGQVAGGEQYTQALGFINSVSRMGDFIQISGGSGNSAVFVLTEEGPT